MFILFIFCLCHFPLFYATMLNPFDTLLLEPALSVSLKYTVNNVDTSMTVPFEKLETTMGQIGAKRKVKQLDSNNFELIYEFTVVGENQVTLRHLEIEFNTDLEKQVMMAEGFQCWSTSAEMDNYGRMDAIPSIVSWITQFDLQGDYDFFNYSGKTGHIHSTGYTYFRHKNSNHVIFLGSVSENTGYTYYKANLNDNKLSIYKDIDGKLLKADEKMQIKLLVSQCDQIADLKSIWKRYADYYDPKHEFRNPRHLTGWSSWYNFYERVTENDVISSLTAFKQQKYPIDVFQIDDGYESQIGDWLQVDQDKFPRGMKVLADEIKAQNYIPGIWLAPYAVGFKSKIVKEHPEWLLKYPDGKFVVAGPNWGGFYAIDIYSDGARTYLRKVFDEVIDVWGYKLLKLDFLFAAAMIPRLGKSRGEIMWDAMDLIVELTRKRALLLGSGVTLPSTWGKLEYSRVSSDASPWWDNSILRLANVRERVATANALTSTINRWPIAMTMFGSDPDVFFVRSDNNKLTNEEKYTLLVVNIIFGQLTLMSDNVNLYNKQEHILYSSIFPKPEAQVQEVITVGNNVYQATYTCHGRDYIFLTNLSPLPFVATLPLYDGTHQYYFEHGNALEKGLRVNWLKPQSNVILKPHETRAFLKIPNESDKLYKFMGSTGHIVPGSELDRFVEEDGIIRITLRKPHMSRESRLYFEVASSDSDLPFVYVEGELARVDRLVYNEDISLAKVTVFEENK